MDEPPIVGREEELTALDAALNALDGPRLVALAGEAGIGKTRLLDELCARAERREHLVFRGRAAEFERRVPFASVVEALDAHLGGLDPGRLVLPHGDLRSELGTIFPSLRTEDTAIGGVQDERYRAYRAVRELLERLAASRPLVLVIDDVQWVDDATAELLSALLEKPPSARVLIALGGRTGQLPPVLAATLATAERRLPTSRLALGPLSRSEAETLLGDRVAATERHALYEAGGGNPFYLEQLARTAGSNGDGDHSPLQRPGLEVPAAVAAALAQEIAALPEPVRRVVQAAAVAGQKFEAGIVAEISGMDEAAVLDLVDTLLESELVRPAGEPRQFTFRHPLVWRGVYESTRSGWRLAAHRAAATALSERGATPAERAHHVEHAAERGDFEAIAVLREAGTAVAHQSPTAAAQWFRAALRLLPPSPDHDAERRSLFVALASALRGQGDLDACRGALRDALDLTPSEDVLGRARLEARCATVEAWLGRADDAHRRLVRARATITDEQSPGAVALDVQLALAALNDLRFDDGIAIATRATAAADAHGDAVSLAEAAAALCLACALAGRMPEAREHHATAVGAIGGLTDAQLSERLEVFFYLAWAENNLEELERGIATAERGIALSRATGQGHLLVPLMLARSLPLDRLGRLTEAIAAGEEAIEAARASPNPQYEFWALWECAYSLTLAGDIGRAIPLLEESMKLSRGLSPNFLCWAQPGSCYGFALTQAGDPERGFTVQIDALGGPEVPRIAPFERVLTHADLAAALLMLGRLDEAAEHVDRAHALAEQLALPGARALAAQARATLLLARDEPAEALRVASAARGPCAAAGIRLDAVFLLRLEGLAQAALGERDAAVATLREAERELDAVSASRVRDDVRRELRRLGARVEPRGPGSGSGFAALSDRERQVAELVADRRMNKEIAAALFLSEKTVESHLRNVFRKLGVGSRADVARAVEREGQVRSPRT